MRHLKAIRVEREKRKAAEEKLAGMERSLQILSKDIASLIINKHIGEAERTRR